MHDLVLVTRNTRHFVPTGAELLNPFVEDRGHTDHE